jgi:catechol 2,3-dioxygenase-like lactoylglutathione lyase family enzyme
MGADNTNVLGVAHAGITVPDLDAATRFFEDAFGAIAVYDGLSEPVSGEGLEHFLGVPAGSTIRQIRMIRIANGANIELFHYTGVDQREPHRPCDYGLQHIAVEVADIDAAVERFVAAGGTALASPMGSPGAEAGEGNKLVYLRAPWGTMIELISLPGTQAYEATTEARCWRPVKTA